MCVVMTRAVVGLITFVVGVVVTNLWISPAVEPRPRTVLPRETRLVMESSVRAVQLGNETGEKKAVRLAEEFIARNGYTDLPADRERLSLESIEWSADVDEMLEARHNTLERRAYGIKHGGRMAAPNGWTVVFQFKQRANTIGDHENFPFDRVGRAVTIDRDFLKLRVEHQSFILAKVDKKL